MRLAPAPDDDNWRLHHATEPLALPLRLAPDAGWPLLALSGGQLLTLFGEWDGQAFRPLGHWLATEFVDEPLSKTAATALP